MGEKSENRMTHADFSFSSFCFFLSFSSRKTELGAATAMDRNNYAKAGDGQNAPT